MDWDKLKTFYVVASQGSLVAAESILNISQSALSRQISQLEYTLKVTLFERHARGVRLSEPGKHLFESVKKVYQELSYAQTKMKEQYDKAEGSLTIIAPEALGAFWIAPYLEEFKKLYPKICVSLLSEDCGDTLQGRVCVSFSFTPLSDSAAFTMTPLCTYEQRIFASKEYLKRCGTPQSLEEVLSHDVIGYYSGVMFPFGHDFLRTLLGKEGSQLKEATILVDSFHGALKAAENNLGLVILPDFIGRQSNLLQEVTLLDAFLLGEMRLQSFLLYPTYLKRFKRVQVFKEFIQEKAKNLINFERN